MNGLLDLWIDGGRRPQIRFAMAAPLAISRDIAVSGWILWPFNLILDGGLGFATCRSNFLEWA